MIGLWGDCVDELNLEAIKGRLQLELQALRKEVIAARAMRDSHGMYNESSDESCDAYDAIHKENQENGL
jgi:hypothetical protein